MIVQAVRYQNKERDTKRTMEKYILMMQLQSLRLKLYEIAEEKGSFTDPDVLAISEEADQLIVALQYLEKKQECSYSNSSSGK